MRTKKPNTEPLPPEVISSLNYRYAQGRIAKCQCSALVAVGNDCPMCYVKVVDKNITQ